MMRASRQVRLQVLFSLILVGSLALLTGCGSLPPAGGGPQTTVSNTAPATTTPTPFQPLSASQTHTPAVGGPAASGTPSPTPDPTPTFPPPLANPSQTIWLAPYLPPGLRSQITLPPEILQVEEPGRAGAQFSVGEGEQAVEWVYALVAPYPTITDQVSRRDLQASWQGDPSGPFAGSPLLMDEYTLGALSAWWGEPGAVAVQVVPSQDLIETAWSVRPSWGIVPFESLEPGWKVLAIAGQSPLRQDFNPDEYPLLVPFSLQGDPGLVEEIQGAANFPPTNRDPDLMTTVAVTGVTALVRATAFTMERQGITYPARDVGEILRSADITHISNEIPFTPDCGFPNPVQEDLRFCSRPEYIELLEEVGTDVVELTGDHFGDWGPDAMLYTLGMYEDRDWIYYGGGYNRADARQARLVEHNGNRIAFIGCNGKGGGYATAGETQPGAVACDYAWLQDQISSLAADGYQVIATFQHFEYYTYYPQPDQTRDFRALAEAGAAVVSGSQAHQPQGIEFYKNAFIHYGLGNLFFDQYHFCTDYACDDGFIDLHIFYDGRYLGNELVPIVFEDYARPRPMTPEEKAALLNKVFSASSWN